jgi:Glycosyl transferases group 1
MEYFKFHFENDLDDLYEMKKFQLKWNVPAEYYDPVIQFAPDLTLVYRGEFLPVEVVRALSGIKVSMSTEPMPKIVDGRLMYTNETLNRFKLFLGTLDRPYDYILHFDDLSKSFFETQNVHLSGFYRFPIATDTYKPVGVTPHRDVIFFGRSTPHRESYLGPLKQHLDTLHVVHGMPGPNEAIDLKYLSLVSSFHIALNLHPEKDITWEPRIQRMMACGLLAVTEPISPNPYLVAGRDYLCVNSPAELYELCQDVVHHPDKYAHIRKSGFDRVQASFRARDVFPELFSNLINGKFPPPRAAPVAWKLDLLSAALQVPDAESLIRRALARD